MIHDKPAIFANSCMAVEGVVFDGIRRLSLNLHGAIAIIDDGQIMVVMVMMWVCDFVVVIRTRYNKNNEVRMRFDVRLTCLTADTSKDLISDLELK